jgi:hypothetical protein
MVKALKAFRVYVIQYNIMAFVPSSSVKEILVQPNNERKRGKWIFKLLEYEPAHKANQDDQGERNSQISIKIKL